MAPADPRYHPAYRPRRTLLPPKRPPTCNLVASSNGVVIGVLSETGSPPVYSFIYAPEWLGAPDTFSISASMPLRSEPYDDAVCRPFFANLLPEGELRDALARKIGVSPDDEFGILIEIGRDCAGAISLSPDATGHGPESLPGYRQLNESQLAEKLDQLPERPLLFGEEGVRLSLAGAQDKLPVALIDGQIALPIDGAASTHIIKPAISRLRESVYNEVFCLTLAARMKLPAVRSEIRFANGTPYALIERYDREKSLAGSIQRIHQEDFCQALGLLPTQKYETRGGPSYSDCFSLISQRSSARAKDRLYFLDAVIFNLLIGNVDAHAKNFSFVIRHNSVRLAPFYDLMCATVYDTITRNMAMKIGGKDRGDYVCKAHWKTFSESCELSLSAVIRKIRTMTRSMPEIAATLHNQMEASAGPATPILGDIVGAIQKRCAAVLRNLDVDHYPEHAERHL